MAAPSMQQNGTITYHNGTNILNARNNNPWSTEYGDHMIRVNVYPGNGCTEGPTTFDMAGNEGQECWNFEHGVSIQVSSATRGLGQKYLLQKYRLANQIGDGEMW
ncbi:MAG: hypothetical protein LQ350_002870 [Teloschistes chrysophthalmus]|nr:MAG: hypothetical protein LQ350_002870 [Niorma chrysophthalma]